MKVIDRYLTREFLGPFLWCMILFMALYIIGDLFGRLGDIIQNQVDFKTLTFFYSSSLPLIFVRTSPVAVLLSLLFILGKLNKYNEITAMKAGGINFWRLILPFLILGIMVSFTILLVSEKAVPRLNILAEEIEKEKIEKNVDKSAEKTIKNISLYGARNRLIYAERFTPRDNTLENITILEQNEKQEVVSKINAEKATYIDERWVFYDSVRYNLDKNAKIIGEPILKEETFIELEETPKDFMARKTSVESMSFNELRAYINKFSGTTTGVVQQLSVDLYYKISFPFITFIIMFIGIPFGIRTQRGGASYGIGICLGLSFCYYVLMAVGMALGKKGILPPFLSAWVGNIIFLILGVVLLVKVRK